MSKVIGKTFPTKKGKTSPAKGETKDGAKTDVKTQESGTAPNPPKEEK